MSMNLRSWTILPRSRAPRPPATARASARAVATTVAALALAVAPGRGAAQAIAHDLTQAGVMSTSATGTGVIVPLADSLLPAVLRAALRAAPELGARRAELAAATARLRATGFAPAAVLGAEIEEVPRGRVGDGNLSLGVEREFFSGARRAAARDVAAAELRVVEANLRAAELRVAAHALRAATQAAGWALVSSRLGGQDSLLLSAEVSLRTRFAVGEARYVDVLRLRTERLRVQGDRALALTEARSGALTLEALLGAADGGARDSAARVVAVALDTAAGGPFVGFLRGELPPAPDVDSLIARSGALELADALVARASASRRLLLATQRPQLVAGLGIQRLGDADGELSPTAGVSITLPFTARRANRAAAAAAEQEVAAAAAVRRAMLARVHGRLRTARDRYQAARDRLAAFDAALLRGAREEREGALAAYRAGDLSLLELLDFERALSRAELERTRAIIDAATALADLIGGSAEVAETTVELPTTFGVTDER